MTFSLALNQVDAALLESLRADRVREGRQLDFKEMLPGGRDEDKREFLSDVSSFANAAGGDLIFGVRERREDGRSTAEIGAIVGLPSLNVDAERLRLEAMIRDGIAPRMPPVTFHEIRRDSGASCLLVRVPRSWAGLHMVTFGNLSRFYSRTSAGKYQLDVHEIRSGFLAAETAYASLRRFRAERVAQVLAQETPIAMAEGPKFILHALPINVTEEAWDRLVGMKEAERATALPILLGSASNWRFNLDGFVIHSMLKDTSRQSYTQVFRSGGIEAVSGALLAMDPSRGGFYAWGVEGRVIDFLGYYQRFWQRIGVTPPMIVGLTIAGIKGWKVLQAPDNWPIDDAAIDRDIINPQEVMSPDLSTPADVVLRPLFDFIWCGGGWPGSPNYHDGRWVAPRR
jgi:schlafen family protein